MIFEFNEERRMLKSLDVVDLGACAIRGTNDLGEEFYFVTKSSYGFTLIFTYGPIIPDIDELPNDVCCKITKIEFNAKKLSKLIFLFLNDKSKAITDAELITEVDALDSCRDLIEYMSSRVGGK